MAFQYKQNVWEYDNIPLEMKQLKQWVVWRTEQRNGRDTKIPYNPIANLPAQSNNPKTWVDFDTARRAVETSNYTGIGFMLSDGWVGVDLDDCAVDIKRYLDGDHTDNIVSEFIHRLNSYAEISPSGTGIHIILKGELPPSGRRKGNVEMYSNGGRYLTVTGHSIGSVNSITDDSDYNNLGHLHQKYIHTPKPEKQHKPIEITKPHNVPTQELIERAINSKTGKRFESFLDGSWEQFYTSQSEADLAFANDLAFWTACDYYQMDEIFRSSSLYRPKWDELRGEYTYGHLTLQKAIDGCMSTYDPTKSKPTFDIEKDKEIPEHKRPRYAYDDTGNAQLYVDMHGDNLRYSYPRKNWFVYDGKVWVIDEMGYTKNMADKTIEYLNSIPPIQHEDLDEEEARKAKAKHIKRTRNSAGKENMIREAQHLLPVDISEFDNDLTLFNLQNGYIDLDTGVVHEHDREKMFTRISNAEYKGEAPAPQWEKFLNEIFDGDGELIEYIQRVVGYSLSGSTEEQMMFILHGNGRNGKSVFLDVISEIMGTYSATINPESIMVRHQQGGASPDIAKLAGARFVTTTESDDGARLNEGLVKQLTGGDKITARFLHENEFEYTPQFKLWMATNHKPIIRGTDDGIWRRIALIPFKVQIPEDKVDKTLPYKLKSELPGIMHWAVEGYLKWRKFGLQEPQIIKEGRQGYRKEMDIIMQFIEEECNTGDQYEVTAQTLYAGYKNWATQNNEYLMTATKFGREISKKFQKEKKGGRNVYYGIDVKRAENRPLKVAY